MRVKWFCGFAFGACWTLAVQGEVRYVRSNADPGGDGSSWLNAFNDLQLALGAAAGGDEIWVARGVYKPASSGNRGMSFFLKDDVALYGGFRGTETQRDQRNSNPKTNGTVLSGDIDSNDLNSDGNFVAEHQGHIQGLNSFHVVFSIAGGATAQAVLDGFTITGGQADGSGENSQGGAIHCGRPRATLANLFLSGNGAALGGGLYCAFTELVLTRSVIQGNVATSQGGGIYFMNSDGTMTQGVLAGNSAALDGGGIYFDEGDVLFVQVLWSGNAAASAGGGMHVEDGHPLVFHSVFAGNSAGLSGAAINGFGAQLDNCIVWANTPLLPMDATSFFANDCVVEGGALFGMNNIADNPRFVRLPDPAHNDFGDLRLLIGSPAIDAGNNSAVPMDLTDLDGDGQTAEPLPVDLAGRTRILNGTVDIGAFEGGYVTFALVYPGLAPEDDANGNGFPNIGEYGFASDPAAPGDLPNRPVIKRSNDALLLEYTHRSNAADLDVALTYSTDLLRWQVAEEGIDFETISTAASGVNAEASTFVLRLMHEAALEFWRLEMRAR